MKVCFLSWHFATPEIFLNYIRHMTPGKSGKWKDMEATTNIDEADFYIIFDGHNYKIDESRAIYFCQHPKVTGYNFNASPSFKTYANKNCLKFFNSDNGLNPGEWWIQASYDELSTLEIPKKKELLSCIVTYQTHNPMYAQRLKFVEEFEKQTMFRSDFRWSLYGRPEEKFKANELLKNVFVGALGNNNPDGSLGSHTIGKDSILKDVVYDLMFDVGPTQNYISERFYDAMLLWAKPIYFGSNNVHEFIPRGSFEYVNILDLNEVNKVIETIKEIPDYKAMGEARDLLLNKYQVWPYVYNVIKGL